MAQYFNINMYKVLLLMILLLIGNKTVEGCAEGWELNNGKCYLFSMKYYGWEDAKIYCEYLGANLVKIDDDEEHKYIKSRISAMELHYAWIGAKYSRVRRKYLWIDGSEITFSGWAPGEPGGRRGCVDYLYKYDYLWHSHCDCKYTRGPFICEKAPKGHDESIVDKEDAAATRTDGPEPTLKPTDSTVNLDDVFKGSDFCGKETTVTADSSTQTEESRLTPSYVQKSTADGIFIPGANVDITDRPDVNISTLDRKVLDTTISTEKTDEDIKIGRVVSEPVCGGVLTSRQGILESPGFPNYYTNNLRCSYTINMDLQDVILLRFDPDNFDIEFASNCVYDRVAVYAGYNSNSLLLGKYCGTTAPQPISSLGQMHIQFWTDGSVVRTGYIAHYTVTECGGVFTEPYGIIETPNGHTDYHNNQNCTWIITVVPNRVIQLKFQMFDLEEHSTCNYDYLDIYDGRSLASPLIGRYCGDAIPSEQIRSTSNTMTINFITDSSVTRAGFRAAYNTTYDKPNKPSYVCYPNNTIIVHDLPANSYYLAVQKIPSSTDIRCTVSRLNTTTIEITGCLKDDPIVFTYGSYAGIESYKIHVGQSVNINITCHEISEDGVSVVINNTFAVNLQVDSENMVDPSYNVTSSLNTTSTNVNEPVAWTITFPVEYIVEVTSCTAEPDTTDNTDLVVQLISEGGCTVDRELISNFEDNLDGTAVATLWSFKFNNYDTILLKCDVIICPGASNACYTICSRQKRDIPDRSYRQADDSFSTVVQSRLHVIDHKSSGTMPAPQTVAVMMFQLVAVLLIK
ncbi:deleted in malignant brain tumors 1 protein-like isoform X2 [Mercenaria mercenaria]|uniref:deleted in malignant brain tumors 1 protein-like isoform X2 n=1 Tax=Mercenaria mercenaria TaxID=6596 RepID=UPI00234F5F14|nr:deleted in malignant brain tumors 1 protein-like isoform X2 [Mercenaria mercenaria]